MVHLLQRAVITVILRLFEIKHVRLLATTTKFLMKKNKIYRQTRFSADTFMDAVQVLRQIGAITKQTLKFNMLQIEHDDAIWNHDAEAEFFADYRKYPHNAFIHLYSKEYQLFASAGPVSADIAVTASNRSQIEYIFAVFESAVSKSRLPDPPPSLIKPVIFIGHGRSGQWRDLKDHLHEKHGHKVEAYETGARAGHTIRDILEDMAAKSSFALLVLTAEDETAEGVQRARQNVIHESGLFQGRLGFSRAIMLLEEGVEEFSNVAGIQYIRFSRQNIRETFGEVLATIRREFD